MWYNWACKCKFRTYLVYTYYNDSEKKVYISLTWIRSYALGNIKPHLIDFAVSINFKDDL